MLRVHRYLEAVASPPFGCVRGLVWKNGFQRYTTLGNYPGIRRIEHDAHAEDAATSGTDAAVPEIHAQQIRILRGMPRSHVFRDSDSPAVPDCASRSGVCLVASRRQSAAVCPFSARSRSRCSPVAQGCRRRGIRGGISRVSFPSRVEHMFDPTGAAGCKVLADLYLQSDLMRAW